MCSLSLSVPSWTARPLIEQEYANEQRKIFKLLTSGEVPVEGKLPVKVLLLEQGQRRPLGVGAASLILLSKLQPSLSDEVLRLNSRRLKQSGEMSVEELRVQAQRARKDGYAIKQPLDMPGVLSISMALTDKVGAPLLALSISALAFRVEKRKNFLIGLLQEQIAALSAKETRSSSRRRG